MKVHFFSQYFYPENFRINELVNYFVKKKYLINITTANPSYPKKFYYKNFYKNRRKYKLYKKINIKRLYAYPRNGSNLSLILNYLTFFLSLCIEILFLLFKKKSDIYFIFCPSPILIALPVILLSKIKKVKVVLWVLDLWPETLKDLNIIKINFFLNILKKFVKYIYDSSSLILVQSEKFKKDILKITNSNIHIFYSWPEEIGNTSRIYNKIIKKKKYTYLLFAGNIGQAQSFDYLIKCAELLDKQKAKVIWLIVGDGRWKNKFQNLVEELNLSHMFIFTGNLSLKKIKPLFNFADALYLSLQKKNVFKKTIPGKLQTYLISGKPIVAMISGEANKIIKESNSGYVVEGDNYKGLMNKIIKFLTLSKKKKKIFGLNGIKYAKQHFNKKKILDDLETQIKLIK